MARQPGNAMEPQRDRQGTLLQVVETLLDKGLVLNADIMVSVAGVELLGIRIRAALASFETAAKYGLDFPAGTDRETAAWQEAMEEKETCPECGKRAPLKQLMDQYCPWCGWQSAYSKHLENGDRPALETSSAEEADDSTSETNESSDESRASSTSQ